MRDEDPGQLADQLEREAERLEEESARLEGRVHGVRQDWERKRADPAVPGANPEQTESSEKKTAD
jgi:hypothetical protein